MKVFRCHFAVLFVFLCFHAEFVLAEIDAFEAIKIAETELASGEYEYYAERYLNKRLELIHASRVYKPAKHHIAFNGCKNVRDKISRANKIYEGISKKMVEMLKDENQDLCKNLMGRGHWLVYFSSVDSDTDGDIAFIIYSDTSEVVYVYKED